MSTEPSSLTPDERALAEQLARMGPRAEPSPALDARVLAAARDAVAVPRRRHRRWPAMLGLAASLVLAVGLAWRLRPVPDGVPEGPPATQAARTEVISAQRNAQPPVAEPSGRIAEDVDGVVARDAGNTQPEAAVTVPPPTVADYLAAAPAARSKAAAEGNSAPAAQAAPEQPQSESAPVESPLPPPSPPAPSPAADNAAPPAPAEQPAASPQAFGDEAARAASAAGDEPSLEVPPATADSPAVRDAWLQRIQALVDDGDIPGAKASLRAFVLRYPDYTLPENLRPLAR